MIGKLLAINLSNALKNAMRGPSKRAKRYTPFLFAALFIYCIGAFLFLFGMMFHTFCAPFFAMGLGWLFFALIAIITFALCFITSIFAVQPIIFNAKDNELLLSMPIKPSAIVVSRILTMLIYEYIFSLMVAIPAIVVWCLSGYANAVGIIVLVLGMLLVPLLALAFGSIVGWIIEMITSRMRRKNLFILIFSLVALVGGGYLNYAIQVYMQQLVAKGEEIAAAVQKAVFPAYHFGLAAAEGNLVSFLLFATCMIIPFAIMCALISQNFIKLATRKRGAAKVEYKEKALHVGGSKQALLSIELKRFLGDAGVLMNAGIGSVFMLALAVFVIGWGDMVREYVNMLKPMMPGIAPVTIGAGMIIVLGSMVTYSASTVSLEGKTLWLVKSLPVAPKEILLIKAVSHVIIAGAPGLLASIACAIAVGGSFLEIFVAIIAPLAFSVLMAFLGVLINLQFPKLDWINPIQVVKQGISVLICMFGAMVLATVLILLYLFVISSVLGIEVYLLICSALFLAISYMVYRYFGNGGAKRLEALG